MEIIKKLNNNVIVSSKDGQEIIAMGRGIAFNREVGSEIDEEDVDKVFTLEDQNITSKFKTLLSEIPIEYMELSEKIINYAKMELGKKLDDSIYIALTDHIYHAIDRYKNNIPIKNGLLWEIKQLHKEEYEIAIEALNMIFEQFQIILPEDEAGFITLHLVNAQFNEDMNNVIDMTKVTQDILTIIKYHFKITFDESSLNYYRFITHLKFLGHRLVKGNHYQGDSDDDLLNVIKKKYPDSYTCTEKIKKFVETQHHYQLTEEEMLYLTIHIQKLIKNKSI